MCVPIILSQGLLRKIESPTTFFQEDKQAWIGEDIHFLEQEKSEQLGKYVGFCWDPENPRSSVVEYSRLVGKQGRIEEAWTAHVPTTGDRDRTGIKMVAFWKIRLADSGDIVWYWDEGLSYMEGAGFVRDYQNARQHVGDVLWAKDVTDLYALDDASVVRLRNIQKIILADVVWGEHSNYPLKFLMKTDDGKKGYRPGTDIDVFLSEWHRENPKDKYTDWKPLFWLAIENRRLTTDMKFDMIRLAWGDPLAEGHNLASRGIQLALWIYRGVNKRIYGLFFINGKLVYWQWKERKFQNMDSIQFRLNHSRIRISCDVHIDWKKLENVQPDAVTFSW